MENLSEEEVKKIEKIFNDKYAAIKEYILSLILPYLPNGAVTFAAPCVDVAFSEVKRDAYKVMLNNEGNDPSLIFSSSCASCKFELVDGNANLVQAIGLISFFFDAAKNKTLVVQT